MKAKLKLSKLDCVRRQLAVAIELFFMERDPVSIHTLAGASYQILVDLNKKRGGQSLLRELGALKGRVVPGKEKEVLNLMSKAENFFKHADRDPDDVIDFGPEQNEIMLWEAAEKYCELSGEVTPEAQAIKAWFCLQHPQLFKSDQKSFRILQNAFPVLGQTGKREFFKLMMEASLLSSHG